MTAYPPVLEHRESRGTRWLRQRRLRVALVVGFFETLLVLFFGLGWFWVLAAAVVAVALHFFVGRRVRYDSVRQITWTAAVSQLIAVLVPVLWELVQFLAILVLVLLGLALLAMLLLDRR
jgi:hypothetical protein